MTSSTKWMVAIFAVVATFAAGMLWGTDVVSELNPSNILASFDGLSEDNASNATSGQLTLPEAVQDAAGIPKPLPQAVGNNLLLNPGGGNVGIGTMFPGELLTLESDRARVRVLTISDDQDSRFDGLRARAGSPHDIVESGDNAARLRGFGFDGVNFEKLGEIRIRVDGEPGLGDMPGRIEFRTTPDGSVDPATRMVIKNTGNVGIGLQNPQRKMHISDVMRLEPRGTAPGSPTIGDIYVDSDTNELCFFDGSAWTGLKAGGTCA